MANYCKHQKKMKLFLNCGDVQSEISSNWSLRVRNEMKRIEKQPVLDTFAKRRRKLELTSQNYRFETQEGAAADY